MQKLAFHHAYMAQEDCTSPTLVGAERNDKMGNESKQACKHGQTEKQV